jgi:hypothetical protein
MNQATIKLGIALVLFTTWVLLVVFNVPNASDLITAIKYALGALGAHTLTMVNPNAGVVITTRAGSYTPVPPSISSTTTESSQ